MSQTPSPSPFSKPARGPSAGLQEFVLLVKGPLVEDLWVPPYRFQVKTQAGRAKSLRLRTAEIKMKAFETQKTEVKSSASLGALKRPG